MQACILRSPAPIETNPLELAEVPKPVPTGQQVLVRVSACGICRTDLHVIEGELPPGKSPITPGHQVVGVIEAAGDRAVYATALAYALRQLKYPDTDHEIALAAAAAAIDALSAT